MGDGNRFGAQLRLARMAWGLALEDVGAAIGISRQYIHQIETGARPPNENTVAALAEVLGVTPDFFRKSPATTHVAPEQCHFRKQLTTPASVTSQVLARGTLFDAFVAKIDTVLELPPVSFPDISVRATDDIEKAAEACRKHWNLGHAVPITNMMRVVENAGAVVTYFEGISERVDALSMDRRRPIIVRSAAKQSLCRQRFDLAHECGHLVMHRGVQTGSRATEDQADKFASAFLLPRAGFVGEFPRGRTLNWPAMFNLKKRWKVSVRAIVRRAYDLQLLSATQYRSANVHLVKTGQAKAERLDDELPMEQPELLDAAIAGLERARPLAIQGMARELGWDHRLYALIVGTSMPRLPPPSNDSNVVSLKSRI